MTNFKDWNYKEMGFNSDSEMKDSITRVQRKMNMTSDELIRAKKKEAFARRKDALNLTAMEEGARLERLDSKVFQLIRDEQQQAKLQAEQKKKQEFMNALGESMKADKEAEAQKEMQAEKEKTDAALQKEIYSKHGVKTDEQKKHDEALSNLLDKINK